MMTDIVRRHADLADLTSEAHYPECEHYRYFLERRWRTGGKALGFVRLNPSTATELKNDPTLDRSQWRASSGGYSALIEVNLFTFRATDPSEMKTACDPVGPSNDDHLQRLLIMATLGETDVICGWGNHGTHLGRANEVLRMFEQHGVIPMVLTKTNEGHPGHPLYVAYKEVAVPLI